MKTAELQKDMFDMQQKVKRYKERIYELESELEKTAATIATLQEKVLTALNRWNDFWLPGSQTFLSPKVNLRAEESPVGPYVSSAVPRVSPSPLFATKVQNTMGLSSRQIFFVLPKIL